MFLTATSEDGTQVSLAPGLLYYRAMLLLYVQNVVCYITVRSCLDGSKPKPKPGIKFFYLICKQATGQLSSRVRSREVCSVSRLSLLFGCRDKL